MNAGKQTEQLRAMARRHVPKWLTWALAVFGVVMLVLAVLNWELVYLLGALLSGIAAYASHQNAPHIYAAVQALDHGVSAERDVTIRAECWSDSESYSVTVVMANLSSWTFDFVPIGWKPKEGTWPATVYTVTEAPWPVLIRFEDGIAYPRAQPKLQSG